MPSLRVVPRLLTLDQIPQLTQALLSGEIDPNIVITPVRLNKPRFQLGLTVLLASISEEKNELTEAVLSLPDTDLDKRDTFGRSAVHYAAANGNIIALKMLLNKGADPNCTNMAGETPLMKACQFIELEAVKFLTQLPGSDLNAVDVVTLFF